MGTDAGLRVVGTIKTIELHTMDVHFEHLTSRQVARICLDIERAIDEEGEELDLDNLVDLQFQGAAELLPRFNAGDRVSIETSSESSLRITSIKPAPLS